MLQSITCEMQVGNSTHLTRLLRLNSTVCVEHLKQCLVLALSRDSRTTEAPAEKLCHCQKEQGGWALRNQRKETVLLKLCG